MPVKAPRRVARKYDPDYSKFAFIMTSCAAKPKTQNVKCSEIMFWPSGFFFVTLFVIFLVILHLVVLFFCHLFGNVFHFFLNNLFNFLIIRSGS